MLLACYLAFLVFSGLQLVYGDHGFLAMEALAAYERQLDANLDGLQEKNRVLRMRYEALRTDPEAIRLEARRLGYYGPADLPIKVSGLERPGAVETGAKVLEFSYANDFMDNFFRSIWFVLALMFYALLSVAERFWERWFPPRRTGLTG